ncbi:MAG: hypothetical protein LBO74_15725 [Candidatus Symbiothrix sp.]|nr:hypothetical protein [Candidatus Symbiothrix sp.]
MSTIELEVQKAELARKILNENDENILQKLMIFFKNTEKKVGTQSWQMTVEELRTEVMQAEEEYEKGLCITHEEFLKKQAEW